MKKKKIRKQFDLPPCNYLLVVGISATCCDHQTIKGDEMEVIEIGALMVDKETFETVDTFQIFIQPERHVTLTSFCQNEFQITQSSVDDALDFIEGFELFVKWLDKYNEYIFCAWGQREELAFIQDCNFHDVHYVLEDVEYVNLKKRFASRQRLKKKCGLGKAMRLAEIASDVTPVKPLDRALFAAKLLPFVIGSERIKPTEKNVKS